MSPSFTLSEAIEDPSLLAALHVGCDSPSPRRLQTHQTAHRLEIVRALGIKEGDRILEIGCGQGDMTAALALAVGDQGHVVAIDPAVGTYGSPYNLGDSQSHLFKSLIGPRITFHLETSTEAFVASLGEDQLPFDHILLVHSSWYFPSPSHLLSTLSVLQTHSSLANASLHLVEWSLSTSLPSPAAQPHILAALLLSAQDTFLPSDGNIHTAFAPKQLRGIANRAGWEELVAEGVIVPEKGLQDGKWEVGGALAESEEAGEGEGVGKERELELISSMREALKSSVERLGGVGLKEVRCMDVWWGSFRKGTEAEQ